MKSRRIDQRGIGDDYQRRAQANGLMPKTRTAPKKPSHPPQRRLLGAALKPTEAALTLAAAIQRQRTQT